MREQAGAEGSASHEKQLSQQRDDEDDDEQQFIVKTKSKSSSSSNMTESEQRYEAIRKQRLADKVRKEAKKSHKERVAEFNDKLEGMSEHYDLPRVSLYSLTRRSMYPC